jgi:hypothetical protein
MRLPSAILRLCGSLALATALASCSIGYDRDWKATTAGKPEKYNFRYHATWANILSGTINAEHEAVPVGKKKDGIVTLSGEKDLGRLGGVYGFTGVASPVEFKADYKSKLDKGVFEMKRPPAH